MHFDGSWFSMWDGFLTTRLRIPTSSLRDSGGIRRLVVRKIHLTWKTIQNAYPLGLLLPYQCWLMFAWTVIVAISVLADVFLDCYCCHISVGWCFLGLLLLPYQCWLMFSWTVIVAISVLDDVFLDCYCCHISVSWCFLGLLVLPYQCWMMFSWTVLSKPDGQYVTVYTGNIGIFIHIVNTTVY